MKLTLCLNELLEEKFKRLAKCEGQLETLEGYAAILLEEAIDVALEDYPDQSEWTEEDEELYQDLSGAA